MPKLTEVQIDALIKRVRTSNKDVDVFYQLVGWFKNYALTEGQGHRQTKRRAHGAAFFAAIECLIEASATTTKPE